jgi:hypothetical protein
MAWRIVKQPNGLYARFSDIVDNFTHYNMDRNEAIETYMPKTERLENLTLQKLGLLIKMGWINQDKEHFANTQKVLITIQESSK